MEHIHVNNFLVVVCCVNYPANEPHAMNTDVNCTSVKCKSKSGLFEHRFFDQVAIDAKSVSNVSTLLASMATWSKKVHSNF